MKNELLGTNSLRPRNLFLSCFIGANLLLSCPTWAQSHLSGQQFIEATSGLVDQLSVRGESIGWHGSLTVGRYNNRLNAWKWTVSYVRKPLDVNTNAEPVRVPVEQFTAGYGYEFMLHRSVFRTFFVRGHVMPFVGYESVNHDRQPVGADSTFSARSRVLAGADAGIEFEFQPVVLGIRQRWNPTSMVQRFHTLFYVGVRLGKWQK